MASAFILELTRTPIGAGLELIRRICQPSSKSKPHVTVRYPVDKLSNGNLQMYKSALVDQIDVLAPGTFSDDVDLADGVTTVFLTCASETLEALSYKPDYPNSIFHISVYDGKASRLAARVLEVMAEFRWHFAVKFRAQPLTRIPIGDAKSKTASVSGVELAPESLALFREIQGAHVTADDLLNLSDDAKIILVRKICSRLNNASRSSNVDTPNLVRKLPIAARYEQPDLWGEVDVRGDGRRHPLLTSTARQSLKKQHSDVGLFLTPPELAQDMVTGALKFHKSRKIDFGDPALGSGIFFATLLRSTDPVRIQSAIGVELDPVRARLTGQRWASRNLDVLVGTFPDADLQAQSRSLIIANPPYVRSQKLDRHVTAQWQRRVLEDTGVEVTGRADLYVYILLSCHRWLAPGAVAAWLLPTEFMQTNYGAALREYFTRCVRLLSLHTYDSSQPLFENARVSSTLVIFQNREPGEADQVIVSKGGMMGEPILQQSLTVATMRRSKKWGSSAWATENTPDHKRRPWTVGDLFRVQRGIATGANHVFVLSPKEVADLRVPREWRKPLIPRARSIEGNVIEAMPNGDPDVEAQQWLIDCSEPIQVVRRRAPALAAYLEQAYEEIKTGRLVRDRDPFYKQEARQPAPFIFSYMSRNTIAGHLGPFFLNRSQAVYLNNLHGMYPRFSMNDAARLGLSDSDLLNMLLEVHQDQFDREGRTYVSGLRKLEPRELMNVELRNVPDKLQELVGPRVASGGSLRG